MQGYRLNSNDLSLKLIAVKIQADPFNPTYKTIFYALQLESNGLIQQALNLYKECPDDEFAQEKVRELTSKNPNDNHVANHIYNEAKSFVTLTAEEDKLLAAIIKFKQQGITLSHKALVTETKFNNTAVSKLLKNLQEKGFISKSFKQYKCIEVLRTPVQYGQVRLLQHPKPIESSVSTKDFAPLLPSFEDKPLTFQNVNKRDPMGSSKTEEAEDVEPLNRINGFRTSL